MPRPSRASRLRRGAEATPATSTSSSELATPALTTIDKVTIIPSDEDEEMHGASGREVGRLRRAKDTSTRALSERRSSVGSNAGTLALAAAQKDREAALSRLDDLTTTTDDAVNSSDVPELGRKELAIESSLLGRNGLGIESSVLGGARGDFSGMEINDSEIFGNLDTSFDNADAKETTGSHGGTRSADTSTFNVSVFRRQPGGRRRQSSIVGKDDAPIRPSSRGPTTPGLGSTLNLGNFRRRQRQPSILLSSAQKANLGIQRSRATSVDTENAVAVDSDVEESFLPEAEGTPVRLSRGRMSAAEEKKEEREAVFDAEVSRETRSKKRKSTESHDTEAAKRQAVEAEAEATIHRSVEADVSSSPLSFHETEEPSSPPSFIMRSIQRRRASQDLDSDILAPPADSDSGEGSPMMWPSLKDLGKKRHGGPSRARKATPALDDNSSDLSDPPSLTHSPNFKATKPAAKNERQESPKLSTADLEALLPRRRRKARRDPYDSGNQEDSASEQGERPRRAAKKKPAKTLNGTSKTNRTNTTSAAAAPTKRTTRRTYGSRSFNKEDTIEGDSIEVNEGGSTPLDDTAFEADVNEETTTTLGLPAELKAASRKFKEVDKWELEFEEVVEPSSDLPEGR